MILMVLIMNTKEKKFSTLIKLLKYDTDGIQRRIAGYLRMDRLVYHQHNIPVRTISSTVTHTTTEIIKELNTSGTKQKMNGKNRRNRKSQRKTTIQQRSKERQDNTGKEKLPLVGRIRNMKRMQ